MLDGRCAVCQLARAWIHAEARSEGTLKLGSSDLHDANAIHGPSPNQAPLLLGDYELVEEIARGGMGVVYKARQVSLNRVVAVKVILNGQFVDEQSVQRFRAEAEAAANLRHPNIIAIHEIGEEDGQHFFSMEYVEGRTLSSIISEHPLPAQRAAQYVKTLAEAIEYAHQHDILHRDLKPSNVLVDGEGHLRIGDFGLAKRMGGGSELTLSGQVLGTPSYMPPEQATGSRDAIGRHSDIYGLGAILYCLTTGRPPFMAATVQETLIQVVQAVPPGLRLLNPKIPRDLETICLKCLEKDPRRRYATAQELADDLGRFIAMEPIRARPVGLFGRSWRWCRRKPALAAVGAAALLLLCVVAIGSPIAALRLNAARLLAEERERKAVRNAYAADMSVVQQAIAQRNYGYALRLLQAHRPAPGARDLRGWEWRHLWDQCRSEGMTNLARHEGEVYSVRVSPKGNFVVSLDSVGVLKVTRVADQATILEVEKAGGPTPAFSPDERLLATHNGDRLRIWDLDQGELPSITAGRGVQIIAFHPKLPQLITVGGGHYRVWDLEGRTLLSEKTVPYDSNSKIATLSADGGSLATSLDNRRVVLWTPGRGAGHVIDTRHVPAGGQPLRLGLSPDGKWLACAVALGAGKEFSLQVWDTATSRQLTNVPAHINYVASVEFSPDGRFMGSSSYDQTAEIWLTEDWQRVAILKGHEGLVDNLSFFPDRLAVVTSSADKTVKLWPFRPRHGSAVLPVGKALTHELISEFLGASSPNNVHLVMMEADASGKQSTGRGVVVDARNLRETKSFALPWTDVTKVAISPGGSFLAICRARTNLVLWKTDDETVLGEFQFQMPGRIKHLKFSPRSNLLGGITSDGAVHMWNVLDRSERSRWATNATNAATFAFSADGKSLAVGHRSGLISVWDTATDSRLLTLSGHASELNNVAFSQVGDLLGSTSWDGTARVWDLTARREIAQFRGSQSSFYRVSFTPDGSRLFVNEWDNAVLFDIEAQRQVAQLKTYFPVFLDNDTALGLSETELWHWKVKPLADYDAIR